MMLTKKLFYTSLCVALLVGMPSMVLAVEVSAGKTSGRAAKDRLDSLRTEAMQQELLKQKPSTIEETPSVTPPQGDALKLMVRTVKVEGNTLLSEKEIFQVTTPYEGRFLDMEQIQRLIAELTGLYRSKGFVTSRAYLPPQGVQDGVLLIKIVEGKVGEVTFKGNKHFSTKLLTKLVNASQGESFDYSKFQKALQRINEHPDRSVKANLVPGKEPGMTDIMLDVQERLPVHVGLGLDNWGSEELGRLRYSLNFAHNNLTGHDDRLYLGGTTSDGFSLQLEEGRYVYPLNNGLSIGANFLLTKTDVGEEFEALDMHGKGKIYGVFLTQDIITTDNLQVRGNVAFDYKDIKEYALGDLQSHDDLRVVRTGLEWDRSDRFGRSILNIEGDFGIPDFMGSMLSKDPMASRDGSGGEFAKAVFGFYRLNPMFWGTQVLWKNNAQYSNNVLPAVEEFQIGGPTSVRAYAPGEYSGDSGYSTSLEWSLPIYGLSKSAKVPLKKATWYDALRFVTFYDMGYVRLKRPGDDEKADHLLKGYGVGIRFNPDNDTAFRVETAWPLGETSSDGDRVHTWFEVQHQF